MLQDIGVLKDENGDGFRPVSAVIMMILMLTFIGAGIYILVSSLS
jgi:hypothetical protein